MNMGKEKFRDSLVCWQANKYVRHRKLQCYEVNDVLCKFMFYFNISLNVICIYAKTSKLCAGLSGNQLLLIHLCKCTVL